MAWPCPSALISACSNAQAYGQESCVQSINDNWTWLLASEVFGPKSSLLLVWGADESGVIMGCQGFRNTGIMGATWVMVFLSLCRAVLDPFTLKL